MPTTCEICTDLKANFRSLIQFDLQGTRQKRKYARLLTTSTPHSKPKLLQVSLGTQMRLKIWEYTRLSNRTIMRKRTCSLLSKACHTGRKGTCISLVNSMLATSRQHLRKWHHRKRQERKQRRRPLESKLVIH